MDAKEAIKKTHLIVLLPESLAGNIKLAHKIYWMADLEQRHVLYLTLIEDEDNRLRVTRSMATMKAATSGNQPLATSKLISRDEWLPALREIYQPDDIVVCHAEQTVKTGFMRTLGIQDYLQNTLKIPARVISGFYHPQQDLFRQWTLSLLFWFGCLLILAGFTWLEIQIDHNQFGVARIGLLFLAVCLNWNAFSVEPHSKNLMGQ